MKKQKRYIVSKGQDTPKYLMAIERIGSWCLEKGNATRFINERKALDILQSSNIDNATIEPIYE